MNNKNHPWRSSSPPPTGILLRYAKKDVENYMAHFNLGYMLEYTDNFSGKVVLLMHTNKGLTMEQAINVTAEKYSP